MDLQILCGCTPGYQTRKGLQTGTAKINDPHKLYIQDLSKTLTFMLQNKKIGNKCFDFFQARKLTIKC